MDLRKRLGEILDAASAGERILIERDHKPLAYLVSVEDAERLEPDKEEVKRRRLEALDRLVAFGKEMRQKYPEPDDGLTYTEWRRQDLQRRTDRIIRASKSGGPRRDRDATGRLDTSAAIAIIRYEPGGGLLPKSSDAASAARVWSCHRTSGSN